MNLGSFCLWSMVILSSFYLLTSPISTFLILASGLQWFYILTEPDRGGWIRWAIGRIMNLLPTKYNICMLCLYKIGLCVDLGKLVFCSILNVEENGGIIIRKYCMNLD